MVTRMAKSVNSALILAFVCIVSIPGLGQTRPDFSGKWILDKARSRQRDPQQFKRQAMEVSQQGTDLNIQIRAVQPNGREFRAYLNLRTDGTPIVAVLGAPQRAVVRWIGRKMVIRWNLDRSGSGESNSGRQGASPPFTWTWTLSSDGRVLVNDTHIYGDVTGEIVEHLVYERNGAR